MRLGYTTSALSVMSDRDLLKKSLRFQVGLVTENRWRTPASYSLLLFYTVKLFHQKTCSAFCNRKNLGGEEDKGSSA